MANKDLYNRAISLLNCLEMIIKDKEQYAIIRKQVLDLANDILRIDKNG